MFMSSTSKILHVQMFLQESQSCLLLTCNIVACIPFESHSYNGLVELVLFW